jgi:hypothetical protein
MSKQKPKSIKNKLKSRNGLIGLFVISLLVGTAAAAIFSNTLTNNFELVSDYPIVLSWASGTGPNGGDMFGNTYLMDTLDIQNLDDVEQIIELRFFMACPVGVILPDVTMKIGAIWLTGSLSGTTIEWSHSITAAALTTASLAFQVNFNLGAPVGSYVMTIYATQ